MLIITRKAGESVVINGNVTVTVCRIKENRVVLGVDAPRDQVIYRNPSPGGNSGNSMAQERGCQNGCLTDETPAFSYRLIPAPPVKMLLQHRRPPTGGRLCCSSILTGGAGISRWEKRMPPP